MGAFEAGGCVEVGEAYGSVGHDEDVGRFEVAVDPARVVEVGEAFADLGEG
ncbi:hypothetical protein GA0115255_124491, partial [Streptomyces sp. Ncost-T6T-2b]